MWINKAGRFWTKKELKKTIAKQKGLIDGIWFAGQEFRLRYNIDMSEPDYYLATWRIRHE